MKRTTSAIISIARDVCTSPWTAILEGDVRRWSSPSHSPAHELPSPQRSCEVLQLSRLTNYEESRQKEAAVNHMAR